MTDNETVLGFSKFEKALIVFVHMAMAGWVGWFVPVIADWVLTLPMVPIEKLISLIASLNSLWVSIVATVIGMFVGVLLAAIIFGERVEITISYQNVQLKLGDKVKAIEKKDISAIYMENKQLVILGENSSELYREVVKANLDSVREAFYQYQYPWVNKDPDESL